MANTALTDTIARIRAIDAEQRRAGDVAVGLWSDDPAVPGVSATVVGGRLTGLVIPQPYMALREDALQAVLNAVIANAFAEWAMAVGRGADG